MHALVDSIEYGLVQAGSALPAESDEPAPRTSQRASSAPKSDADAAKLARAARPS